VITFIVSCVAFGVKVDKFEHEWLRKSAIGDLLVVDFFR